MSGRQRALLRQRFGRAVTLQPRDISITSADEAFLNRALAVVEERMADTMEEAQYVPRRLALRGELGMKREEVVRILGRLFMSRVDVNLCESPSPPTVFPSIPFPFVASPSPASLPCLSPPSAPRLLSLPH